MTTRAPSLLTARQVQERTGLSRSAAYELMAELGCVYPRPRSKRLPADFKPWDA